MMNKNVVIGSSVALGGLALTGIVFAIRRKWKSNKQQKAFADFRTKLTQDKEPESIGRSALQQAFDPDYWRSTGHDDPVISGNAAHKIAMRIHEAWNAGTFWDDLEEEVYEAFKDRQLTSFADVSKVADAYRSNRVAGKELWKHLESKLSESEFAEVKRIVSTKNS